MKNLKFTSWLLLALSALTPAKSFAIDIGLQNQVYRMPNGSTKIPSFGQVRLDSSAAVVGTLPVTNGGTGLAAYTAPTVQRFTTGSGTYTTPAGVKYIVVTVVGGGGGSAGSGTAAGSDAGAGGNTTFGSSLLTANGGGKGNLSAISDSGGAVTVSAPAIQIIAIAGARGQGAGFRQSSAGTAGGTGGVTALGGAGAGTSAGQPGNAAIANSGSGAGGAGSGTSGDNYGGGGGGAGGFIKASIPSPSSSYAYSIGAGGTAGGAGSSGAVGAVGGSGAVTVEEYYF